MGRLPGSVASLETMAIAQTQIPARANSNTIDASHRSRTRMVTQLSAGWEQLFADGPLMVHGGATKDTAAIGGVGTV